MKVLIMGGTRFLGVAIVDELLTAEHEISVFHRGSRAVTWSAPVEHLIGDRDDPEALRQLGQHDFDAVLDLSAYSPTQTELLLDALPEVPRFVNCSTVAVYQPDPLLPWPEDTPYGPYPHWGRYAANKIGCELVLRKCRPDDTVTVSLRPPMVLGPRNYIPREEFILNRVLDDAKILLPGDGQAVHQFVYVRHAAYSFRRVVDLSLDSGYHAFNIASPRCLTSLQGFVDICAEVVGRPAHVRCIGGDPTSEDTGVGNGFDYLFPFANESTISDISAATAAGFIAPFMPLGDMIAEAYGALIADPRRRQWKRTRAEQRALDKLGVG